MKITPNPPPLAPPNVPAATNCFTRVMTWWYGHLARHRLVLSVVLVALGVVFYRSAAHIHWATNALLYFSGDSKIVRDLHTAAAEPGLANDLRLDVHFAAGSKGHLHSAVRRLRRACEQTGQFAWVWAGVSAGAQARAAAALGALGPALLDAHQFQRLCRRVSAVWLDRHFRSVAARLQDPDGQLLAAELQHDPLAWHELRLSALHRLNPLPGAHFANGLLLSRDGRHAMMILAPRVAPANVAASRKMLQQLRAAIARVRRAMPALRVWVIGSALNYASNQQRILRDVVKISLVGTLLVAGAILLFFRRWLTVLICLIPPAVGVGTTMGLAGLLRLHLPLIVLAFSGLICGSTTDYGIQLIAAVKRRMPGRGPGPFSARHEAAIPPESGPAPQADVPMAGAWPGRARESQPGQTAAAAVREMFGPISMSVCTSVTGYSALAFSTAPGLRELGLFVAAATIGIWLVTFLVLPAYLGPWIGLSPPPLFRASLFDFVRRRTYARIDRIRSIEKQEPKIQNRRPWFALGIVAFLAATVFLAWHALRVKYSYHGELLDGSSQKLLRQERLFSRIWGDLRHRGLVVLTDSTASAALTQLQTLHTVLRKLKREHQIANDYTPAAILPDPSQIQRRLVRWRQFWTPLRLAQAHQLVTQAAVKARLRPTAFADSLDDLSAPGSITSARKRLEYSPAALIPDAIILSPSQVTLTAAVMPRRDLPPARQNQWTKAIWHAVPQAGIISGDTLFYNTTRRAAAEMKHLLPLVALLILLPLWLYFRRPLLTLVASLSLGVGFVWLLGAAQWLAGGLNLLSLVPILFTMGVAVDYGIYTAADPAQRRPDESGKTRNPATFLCAATTILGTGAMLLAGHPALHWIGLTLTAGITGGYLASLFLVGPLTRRRFGRTTAQSPGSDQPR